MPHHHEGKCISLTLVFVLCTSAVLLHQAFDTGHTNPTAPGELLQIQDSVLQLQDQDRSAIGFGMSNVQPSGQSPIGALAHGAVKTAYDPMEIPLRLRTLVYRDIRYPNSWCCKDTSDFMCKYLAQVLGNMGVEYLEVDADTLEEILLNEDPKLSILVFSQDIAPDTIWDGSPSSPIVSWLHRGGTVIWTGDWEFYYIGFRNGSYVHETGIETIPFGRRVTISLRSLTQDQPVGVQMTKLGIAYMPSAQSMMSLRPFDGEVIGEDGNEVYGFSRLGNTTVADPGLLKVGEGLFAKIGAIGEKLDAMDRASMIAEFLANRFYGLSVDLMQGRRCFSSDHSGIVYILPSGVSSTYWKQTFGSRIYFYAYSDISESRAHILSDLRVIAEKYEYIIVMVPLEDTELFYHNAYEMDSLARQVGLQILYAILPKNKLGAEWDYLSPGSKKYDLMISDMRFLSGLLTTKAIAIWYGWRERLESPNEIRAFWKSLPFDLRQKYQIWIDQPFVQKAVQSGIAELASELNLTVLTELYSQEAMALYGSAFEHQTIVTGYNNASSVSEWLSSVRSRIDCILNLPQEIKEKRELAIWIFWDSEEKEKLTSFIDGTLVNPLQTESPVIASILENGQICMRPNVRQALI